MVLLVVPVLLTVRCVELGATGWGVAGGADRDDDDDISNKGMAAVAPQ